MDEVSAKKFPESAWKTLCYTLFWLWEIHIIFVAGDGEYFFNLRSHWEGKQPFFLHFVCCDKPSKLIFTSVRLLVIIN